MEGVILIYLSSSSQGLCLHASKFAKYYMKIEWSSFIKVLRHTNLGLYPQTQHKIEMDKRDGKFGPQPVMAVPPIQHMSRIDQPVPPSVGYPLQPTYGVQPYGYPPPPPPPAQGYPATGYPPAAYPPPGYPPPGYH